jgi:hypothetical protein
MNGWVKLHRQLRQSAVFDNPKLLKVWIWILLKATHKERQQIVGRRTVTLQPGQFVFGRYAAAGELDMSPSTVRDYMQLLAEMGNITLQPDTKYTLVTVDNWAFYQSEDELPDIKKTANQHQINIKSTSNGHKQECKEVQECKEIVLTAEEQNFIETLQGIKNYPLDRAKDRELYQTLTQRYPELDILEVARDWAAYKLDKPLDKKSNPRSQLNTACKKAMEWGKNLKKQPPKEAPRYTHQRTDLTDLQKVIAKKTMRGL